LRQSDCQRTKPSQQCHCYSLVFPCYKKLHPTQTLITILQLISPSHKSCHQNHRQLSYQTDKMCWPLINDKPFHQELAADRHGHQGPRLRPNVPYQHNARAPMPRKFSREASLAQGAPFAQQVPIAQRGPSAHQAPLMQQAPSAQRGPSAQQVSPAERGPSVQRGRSVQRGPSAHGGLSAQQEPFVQRGPSARKAASAQRGPSAQQAPSAQRGPSAQKWASA